MLLHYLGKFKIKLCTFHAHKTFQTFTCDFLSPNQQISLKCQKISAKTNTMQNINILLVRSLLSKVGLSTIKHQHRKNLTQWTESTWTNNTWKMQTVCKFVHKRCSKCPPFAQTHTWRHFLHWSLALSIMSCRKSDHKPTLLNCKA